MFNKVILLGNLTRDIELQYLQSGSAMSKSAIAVNSSYINNSGNKVEETMYIDCTFWGRTAENANKFLKKGSKLLLEGSLMFEKWVDQNGNNRSKHTLKVVKMEMLDSNHRTQPAPQQGGVYPPIQQPQQTVVQTGHSTPAVPAAPGTMLSVPSYVPVIDISEDEIPF